MAPVDEALNFLTVSIAEVIDGGSFVANPFSENHDYSYSIFLADLNCYMNNEGQQGPQTYNQKFRNGEICAVYCSTPEEETKLWYRCRILMKLKCVRGITARVLLVDHGIETYVPGTLLKKITSKYVNFPIQHLTCKLYGLKPLTYVASPEQLVTRQVTKIWDTAAKIRLKELTEDHLCRIQFHHVDKEGTFHVTLFTSNDSPYESSDVNVNQLYVEENYAVFEVQVDKEAGKDLNSSKEEGSIVSDSSEPVDEGIKPSPSLSERDQSEIVAARARKKRLFNLTMQSMGDDLRKEIGLPPVLSDDSFDVIMPAGTEDGVNVSDDESCLNGPMGVQRRKDESDQLITKLFGEEGPPKLIDASLGETGGAKTMPKGVWKRANTIVIPRSKTEASNEHVENKTIHKKMPDVKSRTIARSLQNGATDSSTTDSEVESKSPNVRAARMRSNPRAKIFKQGCLKQQIKDEEDDNDFRPSIDSTQLMRLLRGEPSMTEEEKRSGSPRKSTGIPLDFDDVLIHGENAPKCFSIIDDLNVPMELRAALRNNQTREMIVRPTPIQAHAWPAILRLRNVVGIDKEHSGKKLAYLLPIILNFLETPVCYKNLPKGNGPVLLIVTVDWNRGNVIKEMCEKMLYQKRAYYRTKVLYGGRGKLEKEMVSLMNGCEVLVATIPALLKMLDKGCTNLSRVCHMVFDNADILVEKFVEEIKDLIKIYASALTKNIQLNLPHQLVAMGTKWSYGLKSLIGAYFDNPILVIVDKLEAAVFKQVKQYVEICSSAQRMEHVLEFLEGPGANHDVIMFTNSAFEAEKLEKLIEAQSISVVTATEFMSPPELKDIAAAWNSSIRSGQCILVLSDKVTSRLNIRNATCVIHYEFPTKKNEFGSRMHCLKGSTTAKDEKSAEKMECCSLILLTEANETSAPGIVKLLRRARQHVPPFLIAISNKIEKQNEERKKSNDICDDLKLLGSCRDIQRCKQRHTIFADADDPKTLPKSGVIKVKILDVVSANVFWGKVMEDPVGFEGMSKACLKLEYEMQIYYQNQKNRTKHGSAGYGVVEEDLCVTYTKHGYQRVRVDTITKRDAQTAIATEARVFGIDNAEWKTVKVDGLLVLPTSECFSLSNVPPQAIELIVCGVKPVDKSYSWTVEACIRIDNLINGKILEGSIVLSLRNTLWVDPLVQKTKLEGLNAFTTSLHVGVELLEDGFADKNNTHAKNLRALCKDCLPSVVKPFMEKEEKKIQEERSENSSKDYESMTLPEEDYQDVYVSAVDHPGLLFVQLMQSCDKLDKLEDKIESVMKVLPDHETIDVDTLGHGSLCLAKFTIDDKWYRAKILSINEGGEYSVFYVDHGDRECIPKNRLWKAWPEVTELPLQAIECSLVHITPNGAEWSEENGDCLWELCKGKLLVAKVKSKSCSEYAGNERYNIELYDTTGEHDVNISQELVFLGQASGSQACIQEMFPDALCNLENRDCQNEIENIPDICLEIFMTKDNERKVNLAESIQNIVLNSGSNQLDQITASGGVKSLAKLLALSKLPTVQNIIIDVVINITYKNQEGISDDFRKEGGLKALCNILKETENQELIEQVTLALKSLASNKRNKDAIRFYGGIVSLCDLLKEAKTENITLRAMNTLNMLCVENDSNCQCVFDNGGLETLLGMLVNTKNNKLLEECSSAISTLSTNVKLRNSLREIKGFEVVADFIRRCTNSTCLENVLQTLKTSTSANQVNRDYLRNIGMIPIIEKVLFSPVRHGLVVKRLCSELLQRIEMTLNATGSGQKKIQVAKITDCDLPPLLPSDDEPSLCPKTLWCQQNSIITLSIQLRGVINEQVSITPRRLHFSSYTLEHRYELDMELYKEIDPQRSNWNVYGGEVLIMLCKVEKDTWPRLLLSEFKPPYLKCDFDRYVNTSVGTDDEPRKFEQVSLPKNYPSILGVKKYSNGGPDMLFTDSDLSDDESSEEMYDDMQGFGFSE